MGRSRGGRLAEEGDLHRSRAQREDLRKAAARVPHEVDGDVDLPVADQPGDVPGAAITRLDEVFECGSQPRAHRAAAAGAERDGRDLEAIAVVTFEQTGGEIGGGMVVEVRGHIGDPDALVPIALPGP